MVFTRLPVATSIKGKISKGRQCIGKMKFIYIGYKVIVGIGKNKITLITAVYKDSV